jgi:OOP family OmpA-OmpF porin
MVVGVAYAHAPVFNNPGYVVDSSGQFVRDGQGQCVRTGSWTSQDVVPECGGPAKAEEKKAVEMAPPPAGPKPPAMAAITLETDALFDFNKSTLKPEGKAKIDDLIGKMKAHPEIESILATGHADRIGSDKYNMALSDRRVKAVKAYMVSKGVEASRIETVAKGESEPVVSCKEVKGAENRHNKALIKCLAPNRRVVVQVKVQRESK